MKILISVLLLLTCFFQCLSVKEEKDVYNILRDIIFDIDVIKYTTIVRNFFSDFRNSEACEEDKKKMIEESSEISEVISSCNKVIYVDVPPLNVKDERKVAL